MKKKKKKICSVVESNGTVLFTGNFGNKTAYLTKENGLRECGKANGSVIFWSFR